MEGQKAVILIVPVKKEDEHKDGNTCHKLLQGLTYCMESHLR